jgi:hypothetical protein
LGRTVEIAACDRWQLEHVAGDIAASGWYDALTTRILSDATDSFVSAFGSAGCILRSGSRRRGFAYRRAVTAPRRLVVTGEFVPDTIGISEILRSSTS